MSTSTIRYTLAPGARIAEEAEFPALLQIVGGDKLIIPFADGAAHEPIQRPAFSA